MRGSGCEGDEGRRGRGDITFLEPKKVTKKAAFGLEAGRFLCRGSLYEKGEKDHGCEQARPDDFAHLFQFASQTRMALPSGLLLGRGMGNGENAAAAATPHQSPSVTASPQGEAFWVSAISKCLPLEGKVGRVAPRMRCSAPQSALPQSHYSNCCAAMISLLLRLPGIDALK